MVLKNKYVDVFDPQFFNFKNKKVIVYIEKEITNYNNPDIIDAKNKGEIVVNSLEELLEVMK